MNVEPDAPMLGSILSETGRAVAAKRDVRTEPEPENTSGIVPLDLVALIYPDPVEEVSSGGIIIPKTAADKQKYHVQKATLVAVGKSCFHEWVEKPEPGQRVLFAQYAGTLIEGKDGKEYRMVRNEDLIAILEE